MHYLHMLRMDPAWYLQKLWWAGVLLGLILILVTAGKNRRRARTAKAKAEKASPPESGSPRLRG